MASYWMVDDSKTNESSLALKDFQIEDVYADVKWDGCVHYHNGDDYIHYCDIRGEIKKLLELHRKARKHFGKDWGK